MQYIIQEMHCILPYVVAEWCRKDKIQINISKTIVSNYINVDF